MLRLLALFSLALILNTPLGHAADSYTVANGASLSITEHGVCKTVINSTGQSIMVPTKTANEWATGGNSFIQKPPTGVTFSCCGGGVLIGGYCWYLGSSNQSCDNVCATRGGCNLSGTRDYAGSGGTDANCESVLTALGNPGSITSITGEAVGCYKKSVGNNRDTDTTLCSTSKSTFERACACNN